MDYQLVDILDYSVLIAVAIGLARFRKILRTYRPFVYIVTVALVNEIISSRLIAAGHSNAIVSNCYMLVESSLYFWQFKEWNAFSRKPTTGIILYAALVAFWITEKIIFGKIGTFQSGYSITYSFCLVFLAINQLNALILTERSNLLKNGKFIICTGIVIFFTYQILVESFYLFNLYQSDDFMRYVFHILVFVNLLVNLLFAYAAALIPTREPFRLRY